jgi:hypothetical protein
MELQGRPLLDTKPDHELFAAREAELSRLLASVEHRQNALVGGERGSGKTTLLRGLAYELRARRPQDPPPAFVEGYLADDAATFLDLVRLRLGVGPLLREPTPMESAISGSALADTLRLPTLVASLREAVDGGQRVVLVDELPSASVGRTLFGRLRDDLWQLPITWVVAVPQEYAVELLSPPADAFFNTVVNLAPLSRDEQARLLRARAGEKGRRLARAVDEGNPRRLLAVARDAFENGVDPASAIRARHDRDARVSKLGPPAAMLVAELESLGPSSASDEALLKRLGWTRNRATQVFRQLEDAGIVTSSLSRTGGAGRPRKVYALAEKPGADDDPRRDEGE